MKGYVRILLLASVVVCTPAIADEAVSYRPGYFRLATKAAFVGRVRVEEDASSASDDPKCGVIYDVTVVESISGATVGTKLRFVSDPALKATVKQGDAFAVLFNHALPRSGKYECWVAAAPLFAAAHPASVISFDQQGGTALGGEFLPVGPESILSGLKFSAIEITMEGKNRSFASWELVRAYARQVTAVRKAWKLMPEWPTDPGPLPR